MYQAQFLPARETRTPATYAEELQRELVFLWKIHPKNKDPIETIRKIVSDLWSDESTSGDAILKRRLEAANRQVPNPVDLSTLIPAWRHNILVGLAYCVQAVRVEQAGQKDLAWSFIADAQRCCGKFSAQYYQRRRAQGIGIGAARKKAAKAKEDKANGKDPNAWMVPIFDRAYAELEADGSKQRGESKLVTKAKRVAGKEHPHYKDLNIYRARDYLSKSPSHRAFLANQSPPRSRIKKTSTSA
ncbi:hypothetical protein [uncultured Thiodictyon sp.]|uniref:hypothetical protein n=1 Tax=uncultured Thiodictyon sp. TaxID=1846217 RepID=UPI0025EFAF36|nr:hypothetical protein [uncultured Thiodictyon sp.]